MLLPQSSGPLPQRKSCTTGARWGARGSANLGRLARGRGEDQNCAPTAARHFRGCGHKPQLLPTPREGTRQAVDEGAREGNETSDRSHISITCVIMTSAIITIRYYY